jgi:predicted transcriptional regulator
VSDSKVLEFKTPMSKKELVWEFIREHNVTKLREIRDELNCSMNELVDIMKELAAEGFLIAPEGKIKGYRINEDRL